MILWPFKRTMLNKLKNSANWKSTSFFGYMENNSQCGHKQTSTAHNLKRQTNPKSHNLFLVGLEIKTSEPHTEDIPNDTWVIDACEQTWHWTPRGWVFKNNRRHLPLKNSISTHLPGVYLHFLERRNHQPTWFLVVPDSWVPLKWANIWWVMRVREAKWFMSYGGSCAGPCCCWVHGYIQAQVAFAAYLGRWFCCN